MIHSATAMLLLATFVLAAVALFVSGFRLMFAIRRLPHEPQVRSVQRGLLARFAGIVAAEGIACFLVARACLRAHDWKLIVPLILVVVGLHFLPLARLFRVPRYYATGALFCVIPLITILAVPSSAHVGQAVTWIAFPTIACGVVAMATAAAGFAEVQSFLNELNLISPLAV